MDREELIKRLGQAGIKHTPESILRIVERADGSIVFLEIGDERSGWQQILKDHAEDFANRGITNGQIIDLMIKAITYGIIIGRQGRSRTIYEIEFNNVKQYISVEIGSNGYIVSANPTSATLVRRFLRQEPR